MLQPGNGNFLFVGVNVETARQSCYRTQKNVTVMLKFMHARRLLLMQWFLKRLATSHALSSIQGLKLIAWRDGLCGFQLTDMSHKILENTNNLEQSKSKNHISRLDIIICIDLVTLPLLTSAMKLSSSMVYHMTI